MATYVILFAVGLSVIVGFILTFRDYFVRSSLSLEERQEISRSKLQSDMEILSFTYNQSQPTESQMWDSESEFGEGIFDNTTASNATYLGSIILENGNSSGEWYSEIIRANGSVDFQFMNVSGTEPAGSDIRIQLRSAENASSLTGAFLGPDGTEDTYYSVNNPQAISSTHEFHNVFQVKAFMNRTGTEVPQVDWIDVQYAYTNVLEITVKNTGKIKLQKDAMDYFLSTERISREHVYKTEIITATDITNPGIWEPEEELNIFISEPIATGTKMLTVVNEYSTKASKKVII